jgi:hypothetical protein
MENTQNVDITTFVGYEDVKNLVYKLIQAELNKPSLEQVIGYDLANCIRNMDFYQLQDKHRQGFDVYLIKLLSGADRLSLIYSDILETEEELAVFRAKYDELKRQFDIAVARPDWKAGVTEVQVTEEGNQYYGKQYIVSKFYYVPSEKVWMVEVKHPNNPNNKNIFKHTQLGKI